MTYHFLSRQVHQGALYYKVSLTDLCLKLKIALKGFPF